MGRADNAGPSSPRQAVVIMTDTTRWDMLGCYGAAPMVTPALDELAAAGARFDRAYTASPVCAPARSALFTGLWPHENGCWSNDMPLGNGIRTLGERVSVSGVAAAYIGKWHLDGSDYFGDGICPPGWLPDVWYDGRKHLEELSPEERERSRQEASTWEGFDPELTYAYRCTDRAIDFIEDHAQEDFLLVVSYDEPHGPSICPREYAEMYDGNELPVSDPEPNSPTKPSHQRRWAEHSGTMTPEAIAAFLGSQSFVDAQVSRIMGSISANAPDAFVMYTSDHGEAVGSHGLQGKGPAVYDDIARIPLLVRWPGVVSEGTVVPHTASLIDVTRTILDVLDIPAAERIRGSSLRRFFSDDERPEDDKAFVEFGRYEVDHDGFGGLQPMRAVVVGEWKLALHLFSDDEMYNTRQDPEEAHNRIDDEACSEVRNRLHDLILDWMHETRDPFRGWMWESRSWRPDRRPSWNGRGLTRQRLDDPPLPRALDYTTGLVMTEPTREK